MLRLAPAALVLFLSGCLAATPATLQESPARPDDGVVVTATRVEPLVHWVDAYGAFQARLCQGDPCRAFASFETAPRIDDFGDPAALFWRVALRAESEPRHGPTVAGGTGVRMEVFATTPCGIACVKERPIARDDTPGHAGFDALDVYLERGETGIRVRLIPLGSAEGYIGENRLEYRLHGAVGGFRAVADPVIVG